MEFGHYGRNTRRHGKVKWNASATVKHVVAMIEDLLCLDPTNERKPERRRSQWQKPEPVWCKVNTDASFQAATSLGTGGVVIRDEDGRLLAASVKSYNHIPDALTAEAMAARDGLIFARMQGCVKVHLELDNLNLLQSYTGERSYVASLWQEIQELSRSFASFKSSFLYREGKMRQLMYLWAWLLCRTRMSFGYIPFLLVW